MENKQFITLSGREIEFTLERKSVKNIRYKIYPDSSVKIVAPFKVPIHEIKNRMTAKSRWFLKHLDNFTNQKEHPKLEYKDGSAISILGKLLNIRVIESKTIGIKLDGSFLNVYLKDTCEDSKIETLIFNWLKIQSPPIFERILNNCLIRLKEYGIQKPDLKVKKLKSRWGSCNKARKRIVLNLHLIRATPQLIGHVIMHELCHFKYTNHDRKFYDFLSIFEPDWKEKKKELHKIII
jgi:predicted metal-dependent hydrolase